MDDTKAEKKTRRSFNERTLDSLRKQRREAQVAIAAAQDKVAGLDAAIEALERIVATAAVER